MTSLPHPSQPFAIDLRRVAGNTGVLLVHVLAFAALMLPGSWVPAPVAVSDTILILPDEVKPDPIEPTTPPPPKDPPKPIEKKVPVAVDPPREITMQATVDPRPLADSGEQPALPADDTGPVADTFEPGPPQLADLAYAANPAPRYPRTALRAGDEGRVLLRVLVDAQGVPQDVQIERGSGHRDLDRAAREQVLAKWRFHPAMRDGRAVPAWALVPIDFVLP